MDEFFAAECEFCAPECEFLAGPADFCAGPADFCAGPADFSAGECQFFAGECVFFSPIATSKQVSGRPTPPPPRCRTCSGAESLRISLSSKVSTCQNC